MPSRARDVASYLPLKPDVFAILLLLLEGDAHGYRMIKAADERTGRKGQLQPGALYRLLKQMLDHDLVREVDPPGVTESRDERRRYYRITSFGRSVAEAEARRMAELVGMSRKVHLIKEGESA